MKDRRNGKGSHIFRDMTRYEGQFFNDDMHGLGTFYYRNGSVYRMPLFLPPLFILSAFTTLLHCLSSFGSRA